MQSGWNKLFPSEVMDCVSAGLGRRDLEQIIFCCYHSNPTQGTLWGCDRASLSISSWFTDAGWSATAPAAQCSAFPLLQGSSSLGCSCIFFSQKTALGQTKSKLVSWGWLSKDRGTDKFFTLHFINSSLTSSRMSWKLQWTTNNSCFSVLASEHMVLHPSAPEQRLSPRIPAIVEYISFNLPWMWGGEGHFTSRWLNLSRLCVQAFQPHTLET